MSLVRAAELSGFESSFGDLSVTLPRGLKPPCQWADSVLSDLEYFGRWKAWRELNDPFASQSDLDEYSPISPDQACLPKPPHS
jgi:hypothetical protein